MESSNRGPVSSERLNRVYLAIISRYKDYIEEKEGLSVAELPTLVMPNDPKVIEKTEEIKSEFLNYSYDQSFYEASMRAYKFITEEISDVTLPLQFWLTPSETIEFEMGDQIDKSILLCSMLVRLGNPSSKVFVIVREDNSREISVYYTLDGKLYLLGSDSGVRSFAGKDQMLERLVISENDSAYEFNNQMYADIF